jgi:hypothetical protein
MGHTVGRPGQSCVNAMTVALRAAFVSLCLLPHAARLRFPSLVGDDVLRVEDLQAYPLSSLWFRPFNEHMAPIFETVSWATWRLAGRRLAAAPLAFTIASFLPFVLCLAALGKLARRAFGSATTARVAVVLFALTPAYFEVVAWYSASSFAWAMLFTLLALRCAVEMRGAGTPRACWGGALAAFLAPACSAIGLLAGPAAALVAWAQEDGESRNRLRAVAWASTLLAGPAAYLGLTSLFRYHAVLNSSARRTLDLANGLYSVSRGPFYLVATGLLGVGNAERGIPRGVELIFLVLATAAALVLARRSAWGRWAGVGLFLMFGGYAITFCFRTWLAGVDSTLTFSRYHVFPQLGLVLILAAALRPWLVRLDGNPLAGLAAVATLAGVLYAWNGPDIRARGCWFHYPEQPATLSGLDRLAEVCRRRGISREQAMAALDPVPARWTNGGRSILGLLPQTSGAATMPPGLVRATILADLTPAERGAIFAGMDASAYLVRADDFVGQDAPRAGRLTGTVRLRPDKPEGRFHALRRQAILKYEFPAVPAPPAALGLPGVVADAPFQVWWTDPTGDWSPDRSVTVPPPATGGREDRVLLLDRLPHWGPTDGRGIRIVFTRPGQVAVAGAPTLLR